MTSEPRQGETVVVTGASSGIGRAIATSVARCARTETIVLVGRNRRALSATLDEVTKRSDVAGEVEVCDFADLSAVADMSDRIAARHLKIDTLFSNAGLLASRHTTTPQGYELTWQVNYLAGFLLMAALKGRLAGGRIVVTASDSYRDATLMPGREGEGWAIADKWSAGKAYANTKLANIMMAREANRRWPEVAAYSFHPGEIRTRFGRGTIAAPYFRWNPFLRSAEKGADTAVWISQTRTDELQPGGYYFDRKLRQATTGDSQFEKHFWDATVEHLNM